MLDEANNTLRRPRNAENVKDASIGSTDWKVDFPKKSSPLEVDLVQDLGEHFWYDMSVFAMGFLGLGKASGNVAIDLVADSVLEIIKLVVNLVVDLVTEEGAETAPATRDGPEDTVDEIDPDGALHDRDARALILIKVIGLGEKGTGEDAKDDEPEQKEQQIPREEAMGLDEWLRDSEESTGDARRASDEESKDPCWVLGTVVAGVGGNTATVKATDDEGEDELDTAGNEASHCLVDEDGLRGSTLAKGLDSRFEHHGDGGDFWSSE